MIPGTVNGADQKRKTAGNKENGIKPEDDLLPVEPVGNVTA